MRIVRRSFQYMTVKHKRPHPGRCRSLPGGEVGGSFIWGAGSGSESGPGQGGPELHSGGRCVGPRRRFCSGALDLWGMSKGCRAPRTHNLWPSCRWRSAWRRRPHCKKKKKKKSVTDAWKGRSAPASIKVPRVFHNFPPPMRCETETHTTEQA